tara:strand:- start:1520 stop:1786 length:267 start_codon:yes stop_codon:yes gene_type:complete
MNAKVFTSLTWAFAGLASGLNSAARLIVTGSRIVSDKVYDKKRYRVELMVDGATLKTKEDQSAKMVSKLLENMQDYGITGVIVHEQED